LAPRGDCAVLAVLVVLDEFGVFVAVLPRFDGVRFFGVLAAFDEFAVFRVLAPFDEFAVLDVLAVFDDPRVFDAVARLREPARWADPAPRVVVRDFGGWALLRRGGEVEALVEALRREAPVAPVP
jgi:hypothetical protein